MNDMHTINMHVIQDYYYRFTKSGKMSFGPAEVYSIVLGRSLRLASALPN